METEDTMGWKDLFKKDRAQDTPSLADLTLPKLKVGYFLDYDMKTWCVEGYGHYEWGEGDRTYEWQLVSHDDTIYLEREPDDEDLWSISRKIPIGKLGADIKAHILEHEDPPDQILYEGITYHLDETGGGHFCKDGESPGQEMLSWDYLDDSGKQYLSIEQWGETDFEAAIGHPVEEYQFDNILPSGDAGD
jgi:hypothetical protein